MLSPVASAVNKARGWESFFGTLLVAFMEPLSSFSEEHFFLRSFRHRLLVFVLASPQAHREEPSFQAALLRGIQRLNQHGVRTLLITRHGAEGLQHALSGLGATLTLQWPAEGMEGCLPTALPQLWQQLLPEDPTVATHATLALTTVDEAAFFHDLVQLCSCFRPGRVVMLDDAGGVRSKQGELLNFVSSERLQRLSMAPWDRRQSMLQAIHDLLGVVDAVSLCRVAELEQELLTYEGCGTFFSTHHYCRVRRLGVDDLSLVRSLIQRGEDEGFLMQRPESHLYTLIHQGWGGFVGEGSGMAANMAGVVGLMTAPYVQRRMGEVISIYTLTRYKGNGVGGHLLAQLADYGRELGLQKLFATTVSPRVADFFQRNGYAQVSAESLPAEKWQGYDPQRRERAFCLMLSLGGEK
uniref:Amino-acid acetyltransferase n=1 Tax=Magnetococcus massalia (strain MO-1) TaxID=451514 RepID=A0A1S7LFG0_MAGMO|nr:putative Amino-acid N-acetyltransferase [Candidatus Magnetococcus massalia]